MSSTFSALSVAVSTSPEGSSIPYSLERCETGSAAYCSAITGVSVIRAATVAVIYRSSGPDRSSVTSPGSSISAIGFMATAFTSWAACLKVLTVNTSCREGTATDLTGVPSVAAAHSPTTVSVEGYGTKYSSSIPVGATSRGSSPGTVGGRVSGISTWC